MTQPDRLVAALGGVRSTAQFASVFARLGFDPADEAVAWGEGRPAEVLESRVIAKAGESMFGDAYAVITLELKDNTLKLERQVIERLRKTYPLALYITTCAPPAGRARSWRLVDARAGARGTKRAVYRRITLEAGERVTRTVSEQLLKLEVTPNDTPPQVATRAREEAEREVVERLVVRAPEPEGKPEEEA